MWCSLNCLIITLLTLWYNINKVMFEGAKQPAYEVLMLNKALFCKYACTSLSCTFRSELLHEYHCRCVQLWRDSRRCWQLRDNVRDGADGVVLPISCAGRKVLQVFAILPYATEWQLDAWLLCFAAFIPYESHERNFLEKNLALR